MIDRYSSAEMNAAIDKVQAAKAKDPTGWRFLETFRLPSNTLVAYAFVNADLHLQRLTGEDERVIYSAGWLNGVAIGVALGQGREA